MSLTIPKWIRPSIQAIGSVVLFILFITFFWRERNELSHLRQIVTGANLSFLSLGIFLSLLTIFIQGLFYQSTLAMLHKEIPFRVALSTYLKRFFLGSFIPAGATVSQFTFSDEAEEHKVNELESHLAAAFFIFIGAIVYILILYPTALYSYLTGRLSGAESLSSLILIIITLLLFIDFFILFEQRGVIFTLASKIRPNVPRFIASWRNRAFNQEAMARAFLYAGLYQATSIVIVLVTFQALNLPGDIYVALVCYVTTVLLLTISPVFQGIGLVEFSLVYTLQRFGFEKDQAVAITILYRLFQLWIPLLIGFIVYLQSKISDSLQKPKN
jgi:phosphatidylglycerol lysyltransferase